MIFYYKFLFFNKNEIVKRREISKDNEKIDVGSSAKVLKLSKL